MPIDEEENQTIVIFCSCSTFFFFLYGWSIAFNNDMDSEREADIST